MRVLAVLAAAAALSVAAGTVTPTALADPPVAPFNSIYSAPSTSEYSADLKAIIQARGGLTSPTFVNLYNAQGAAEKQALQTWLWRGRVAARMLPALASRAAIPLTAAYVGWQVYRHFTSDGGDDNIVIYLSSPALGSNVLVDPSSLPTGAYPGFGSAPPTGNISYSQAQWRRLTRIYPGTGSWDEACPSTYPSSEGCWRLDIKAYYNGYYDYTIPGTGRTWGSNNRVEEHICGYDVEISGGNPDGCWYGNSPWDWADATRALNYLVWHSYEAAAAAGKATKTVTPWYDKSPGTANRLTNFYGYFRTAAELEAQTEILDPAGKSPTDSSSYTVPATAGETDADLTGFLDAFDTVCGRSFINALLDPAHYGYPTDCTGSPPASEPAYDPNTLTLLQPMVNETYTAYIARLQAAGYVGTVTTHLLPEDDPAVGASAVARVQYDGKTLVTTRWPTPAPVIADDLSLDVWHNSSSAPPAEDTTGGGTPGALPPGDPGDCVCPGIVFEPLTELNTGDKFPFGLFRFAADALAAFVVEPEAPSWSFDTPDLAGQDVGTYDVSLTFFDDYMATLRTIISVVLWIGSVWWFANRILGLNVGDNPAEAAADETSL